MRVARLVARSLAHHKALLAGMSVVLAGFQVLLVVIGASLQREGLFNQLAALIPPGFQAALGGTLIASFGGLVAFGFFHPVVVLALGVGGGSLAGELAGDVESGLIDLIAARPVARGLLVARSALAMAVATAAIVGLMLLANRAATLLCTPAGSQSPHLLPLVKLAANLLAVTWCCGAAGLAIAAVARKRATATGGAALVFISLYLLNFAATWWKPVRPIARFSPFHYFDAMPVMMGTHDPTRDILILGAAAAVLVLCAWLVYRGRDL